MNKMMRQASLLAIAFIVSIPLGLMAQDEGFYPYSFARLSYVNGSVYVQRTSDLGYEKGEVNLALVQGDKMGTENGQAEIHFGRRNYLRLNDYTKVEFAVLPKEGEERIKIHLTEGSAYFRVSHLALDKGIEVHTPDASFYVLEEGLYRFDVRLDQETEVFVREGSLEAAAEDGSVLVRDKETVTAADGRLLGEPEYSISREDGFDDWNGSRDAELSQRSERQYLPSEIEEYEEELDQNGNWVYERPYGNVWVPNVSYYDDWRPYSYGRWVWYPVIGWTWVSSESWGWPVYHYGRWNWRFGLGWYWIPRNHWGPAWVHWWWDRDHIGWCPLTWYNRPGLLVDNRFYDRFDDRYFSAHNRAMTVVRRDHLQSRDIGRRQIGRSELNRIDKVALRAEQPSIRPAVDNARPQALAAKRALADRPGSRSEVKSLAPSRSLSSSRLRQGTVNSGARTRERDVSLSNPNRNAVSRPAVKNPETGSRAIRSYPSQKVSGNRSEGVASENRRNAVAAPVRRSGAETGSNAARVSPSQGQASGSPKSGTAREPQRTRKTENESGSAVTKKGETIKNDPSSSRSESTAVRQRTSTTARTIRSGSDRPSTEYPARSNRTDSTPSRSLGSSPRPTSGTSSARSQSPTYSSRSSVSRTSSRLSAPSSSASRSSSSISRPSSSARSSSPSYSRPGSSRSSSSSQSRSSYSAPSRSSGSSGRSISAPRSTSSSSGRSYSAPRSSGSSSSGRSASSGRSSSSSSKSSGSSSKSGSVKRKG
ncbi:MAG: hypothetical protein A2V57_02655 [Candidatus Aminicenantes bacterium RBG_19FT_COMBO_65_30]|nr:MAG: hypothetical protein A2V57_02655 [Candidatus Aminicenantes bacterium RBG_19FT_COMBO_65_30]